MANTVVLDRRQTKCRGIEVMLPTLQLLDLTPCGRQETCEGSPTGSPRDKTGLGSRRDGRFLAQWRRADAAAD